MDCLLLLLPFSNYIRQQLRVGLYLTFVANITILCFLGDDITFSPSTPLCIGETVQMVCYVVPPTAQQFIDSVALISFNGSGAATVTNINNNALAGVDTSRYTADVSGLTISTSTPGIRLTITDYQASDGATDFSCHGLYSGGNGGPSPALITEMPQRLAGLSRLFSNNLFVYISILDPPSSPIVTLSQTDISCSNTLISWSTPSSDRSITSYSVYRDDTLIYTGPNTTNQSTDNTQLSVSTVYEYSVVAVSCAGTSTAGVKSVSIDGEVTCLLLLLLFVYKFSFCRIFTNKQSSYLP